jgi:hypothetical protein
MKASRRKSVAVWRLDRGRLPDITGVPLGLTFVVVGIAPVGLFVWLRLREASTACTSRAPRE